MKECNNTTFEQVLDTQGVLVFTNKGVSMLPLLRQDRDLMIIEKKGADRFKKYDAVLFKRKNGQYVLHRILKVREKDYWIVGDNCVSGEYVCDDQILGILTSVVRDGNTISTSNLFYRIYVQTWCRCYPVRFFLLRGRNFVYRCYHFIKKHFHQ